MKVIQIILGLALAIYAAVAGKDWKNSNKWKRSSIVASILLALVIGYNSTADWRKQRKIERVLAKAGTIEDVAGASVPKVRMCGGPTFIVGNHTLFADADKRPLLGAYIKNGELCVFAVVYDIYGEPVAVIDGNDWTLYSDDFEYQNNKTGFELVTKGERNVYFQIYLKNGVANFCGALLSRDGYGLYWLRKNDSTLGRPVTAEDGDFTVSSIKKHFKYPRELYIGETSD